MTIRALDVALSQLGVQEATGHNDGVPAERYMRGDELAWCAGFLLWCNECSDDERIAYDDATYYKCRSVTGFIEHLRKLGCFFSRGTMEPKPNDLIFFGNTDSDVGIAGKHCGIVDSVADGRVHTIEGNTSNRVARRSYLTSDRTILGYGRLPQAT